MGIGDFKNGYQPGTNIVKDGKGDLVADSNSILARRKNRFSQLFNAHGVNDDRQTEIHTSEPLGTEPSAFEVEIAIEKQKRHRSPGIDQIPAELIKAGAKKSTLRSLNLLILFGMRRNFLKSGRSRLFCLFERRAIKQTVVIMETFHFGQIHKHIVSSILLSRLTRYAEEIIGNHQCVFRHNRSYTNHILCILQIMEKNWEYSEAACQLFIYFKKFNDSVRREVCTIFSLSSTSP